MGTIQGNTSINLIKEEIDATLKQAEVNLEAFVDDPANKAQLTECIECFHQVWGALQVVNVPGAIDLALELEAVARQVLGHATARENEIAALGGGILVLRGYIEYLQIKNRNLPQLLVSAINSLRVAAGKSPISESAFFSCNMQAKRSGEDGSASVSDAEIRRLVPRLRQMYQVGLLGVLRDKNVATSLKMMDRAIERVDTLGGGTPMGRLWWVARGALRALGQPHVEIDRTRKIYLGGIDRHLKQLAQEGGALLRSEPPRVLLREGIYLSALLPLKDPLGIAIRKTFQVDPDSPTAAQFAEERDVMTGPGGSVIRTVAGQLRSELAAVKDMLDQAVRNPGSGGGYGEVADAMIKVAHTLVMLGLLRESQTVKDLAEDLRAWDDGRAVDSGSAGFQHFIDQLLAVENAVAVLELRFTPGETTLTGSAGQTQGSLYQLDDAKRTVLAECRAGIALAKRGITSYIEANFDRMHLNNIPPTIKGVAGGLQFLNLGRAVAILEACIAHIENRLLNTKLPPPGANDMETLADAITGVDYFLESMEERKPIGEGVLEVAESSMDELGCPVAKRM